MGTAKATDSSVKKILWHMAMLMAPQNAFGLAARKTLVTAAFEASSCSDPSWAHAHVHSKFIPVISYTAQ